MKNMHKKLGIFIGSFYICRVDKKERNYKVAFEYSVGNLKIGKDTLIFNMGSATNCASGKAGLCELYKTNNCYAMKAETQYPQILPFRTRQEEYWLNNDAETIAEDIHKAVYRKTKVAIKYVRVNESGDMHSIDCLNKLIAIAQMLPQIKFYTYTHRSDIIGEGVELPKNLVINCSNFTAKGCNSFSIVEDVKVRSLKKEFKIARKVIRKFKGEKALTCIGDCSKCNLCKYTHEKTIWVPLHQGELK